MHCPLHDRLILLIAAPEELRSSMLRAHLTTGFWRTLRLAAIAGIILRGASPVGHDHAAHGPLRRSLQTLLGHTEAHPDPLSLSLVPFAGIAFLWFIGVVREQLGAVEDRLFSTVFMGSGLLFWPCCLRGQRSRQA